MHTSMSGSGIPGVKRTWGVTRSTGSQPLVWSRGECTCWFQYVINARFSLRVRVAISIKVSLSVSLYLSLSRSRALSLSLKHTHLCGRNRARERGRNKGGRLSGSIEVVRAQHSERVRTPVKLMGLGTARKPVALSVGPPLCLNGKFYRRTYG